MDILPEYYEVVLSKNHEQDIKKVSFYKGISNQKMRTIKLKEDGQFEEEYKLEKSLPDKYLDELYKYELFNFTRMPSFLGKRYFLFNNEGFTNAFRKMYEVCKQTNFIPNQKKIRHLDLCGMPGAFVIAINHFLKQNIIKREYDWYIQSYMDKGYLPDQYGLAKKYPERLLVRKNGDIMCPEERTYLSDFFSKEKCDIVTGDCGLNRLDKPYYSREEQMTKAFLAQYSAGMRCLRVGGNFFMKFYNFYSSFNISLIYIMACQFKTVKMIKPESSRQFRGREIYILCLGYNGMDINFEKVISDFDISNLADSLVSKAKMDKYLLEHIIDNLIAYYVKHDEQIKKKNTFLAEKIPYDIVNDRTDYLRCLKQLHRKDVERIIKWYKDYLKRMEYKSIAKHDKLL